MPVFVETHYESDIQILKNSEEDGKLIVKKTYKSEEPVIKFLNEYLREFYLNKFNGSNKVMPVAAHEFFILKVLEPFNIAPRPLKLERDSVYMAFEGNSILHPDFVITQDEFCRQAKNILHILHKIGIRHNDLLPSNVLIRDWSLKIIDFTLADYKDIDIVQSLPNRNWARLNEDYNILNYKKYFPEKLSGENIAQARKQYKEIAKTVYNYHNLGVNNFTDEEKTPYGSGERYCFDRMSMMVMNYDFYGKNVLDLGCNSGWFLFQIAMLGAKKVVGVDYEMQGIMGEAVRYAKAFSNYLQAGINIVDQNIETVELDWLAYNHQIPCFDATILFSVLHHIQDKQRLTENIFNNTKEVVFYEDHEFWNELYDDEDNLIETQGEGYRFGWNKDMNWQDKMSSLKKHEPLVIKAFKDSWRRDTLLLDKYSKIKLLGFSEKRRPVLALFK